MGFFNWFGKSKTKQPQNSWGLRDPNSWWPLVGTVQTPSGVRVDEKSAQNYSAVFCALRIIGETVAGLPRHVLEIKDERTNRKASEMSLYRVLHDVANPEQDSFSFFDMQASLMAGWGNSFAEVVRDDLDRIVALYPIHPSRIPTRNIWRNPTDPRDFGRIEIGQPGEMVYWIRNDDGTETPLPASDMFHVAGVLTENGITGKSIIRAGAESIGIAMAIEQHAGAYFRNGATPSMAIKLKGKLGKEAAERLSQEWQRAFGGNKNSYKTVVLEDDSEIEPFNISPEDSQLLGARQFGPTEISRWFRIPPHMLSDLSRSTYSNISQQSLEFVNYSIMPWIQRFESAMFRQLLTPAQQSRYRIRFNLNGLLRGDEASRAAFYTSLFNLGAISPNDIRELENMNPIPGGDQYFVGGQPLAAKLGNGSRAASNGRTERFLEHSN